MDGFDLLFSTNTESAAPDGEAEAAGPDPSYGLYRSTTREVIGYLDLARWEAFKELLHGIAWWLLLALAALIGIIYLLEKWRDITSLWHKCLAGSVIVHLAVLFLMMTWMITQRLDAGSEPQSPEVALSIDALAEEQLAMESEQELAQIAKTTRMIVAKTNNDFSEAKFEATDVAVDPKAIVRQSTPESLVSNPKPSSASESDTPEPLPMKEEALPSAAELTPTELPGLEVAKLEVKVETDAPPVDPTEDDFKPDPKAIQKVEADQLKLERVQSPSIDVKSDAKSAPSNTQTAAATDTGGKTVNPSEGFESNQPLPDIDGKDGPTGLSTNLPGSDPLDSFANRPKLETPKHDLDPKALTQLVRKNEGKPSIEVIKQLGGVRGHGKSHRRRARLADQAPGAGRQLGHGQARQQVAIQHRGRRARAALLLRLGHQAWRVRRQGQAPPAPRGRRQSAQVAH